LITGINHGLVVGNVIQINGVAATPTSGAANEVWPGNVTADQINGWHTITTAGTDHIIFKITGLNPTDVAGNVGGPNAQYAKVTGTHEANDGVVGQGSTLELVPDTGSNVNIKYTPVTYSNNIYLYNPYQTYSTSWTQTETLTAVAVDDAVCLALNATMTITNSIGGSAPVASGPLNETPFPTVMTFDSGTLPTGLTYVPSTGVLSGTATTAGTYTFTMAATNGYWNAKRQFSLTVGSSGSAASYTITFASGGTIPDSGGPPGWGPCAVQFEDYEGTKIVFEMDTANDGVFTGGSGNTLLVPASAAVADVLTELVAKVNASALKMTASNPSGLIFTITQDADGVAGNTTITNHDPVNGSSMAGQFWGSANPTTDFIWRENIMGGPDSLTGGS
jgi:hypothetical protein